MHLQGQHRWLQWANKINLSGKKSTRMVPFKLHTIIECVFDRFRCISKLFTHQSE